MVGVSAFHCSPTHKHAGCGKLGEFKFLLSEIQGLTFDSSHNIGVNEEKSSGFLKHISAPFASLCLSACPQVSKREWREENEKCKSVAFLCPPPPGRSDAP